MLLTRTLSALILTPIAIGLIWIGGWPFFGLLALLLSLAAYEFAQLMRQGGFQPTWFFSIGLTLSILLDTLIPQANFLRPAIALILVGSLTWQMGHRSGAPTVDWALSLVGGLYLGWAGAHIVLLRQLPNGERWLLLTLAGTWLADIGAFLVGSRLGRRKMTPSLSPKKSWEGLAGGAAFGIGLSAIVAAGLGLSAIHGAALGALGAIVGTLGDLSISMIKRQVGAKDSGQLIPGHGGILDRLDSLLFTAITGYYYIVWIVSSR